MINVRELKAQMTRCGVTQTQLAKVLDLSYPSVSYKVNGLRDFNREEIIKISEFLNLTPEMRDHIFFEQ